MTLLKPLMTKLLNNEIKISCEGDGFRYEYLEDVSKLISKCSGLLTQFKNKN